VSRKIIGFGNSKVFVFTAVVTFGRSGWYMCSGRLVVRVAFRIKVAFILEQVCLRFVHLFLDLFLCPDWLFWVGNNCVNVACN
jgi:hypothetical protein